MAPPQQRVVVAALEAEEVGLLRDIVSRDRGAFDRLYRRYYRRLARFLEQIVRHPHLIEEIVNDTMLVVWTSAARFNHASRVSTWIFGIAYKTALRAIRRTGRVKGSDEDYEGVTDVTPEHELMAHQRRHRVLQALSTLPREQRAVVELTYYHGCAYQEIADILGCPVDTVKTRMFHARRKLKPLLGMEAE